jgi:hypothetical protein
MSSADLLATGLLVASLLIFMNVLLRTWPERIVWSTTLCLAALWGIHKADFYYVKMACWSVFILAMLVSLTLQYVRHRRVITRDAGNPAPPPFTLRQVVRRIASWTWVGGVLACFAMFWLGAMMLGESVPTTRLYLKETTIMLALYALPLWLVPCVAVLFLSSFSVVERWVAWLPLFIAAIFYAVLVTL